MSDFIDYDSRELPGGEDYKEWTYADRRTYILSEIRDAGGPRGINQAAIARQFDVSPATVHNDVDVLADYIEETMGDRRQMRTTMVVERAIQGLLENDQYRKAAQTALEWNEWVAREGELAEVKDQLADLLEERDRRQTAADRDGGNGSAGRDEGEDEKNHGSVPLPIGGDDR